GGPPRDVPPNRANAERSAAAVLVTAIRLELRLVIRGALPHQARERGGAGRIERQAGRASRALEGLDPLERIFRTQISGAGDRLAGQRADHVEISGNDDGDGDARRARGGGGSLEMIDDEVAHAPRPRP